MKSSRSSILVVVEQVRVTRSLVLVASLFVMGMLITTNIRRYYTYPYATNVNIHRDHAPSPSIAVCPTSFYTFPSDDGTRENITDTDILHWLHRDLSESFLLKLDNASGTYKINEDLYYFAKNLTLGNESALLEELKSKEISQNWIIKPHTMYLLDRLTLVDRNLKINLEREYLPFLERFGLMHSDISICIVLTGEPSPFLLSGSYNPCKSEFKPIFTRYGSCITLPGITFQNQDKSNFNELYISTTIPAVFILYDPAEIPNHNYESVIFDSNLVNSNDVTISRVYRQKLLGKPYRDKDCSSERRSECMADCLIRKKQCYDFYNSDRESARGKRVCSLNVWAVAEIPDYECKMECISSCDATIYNIRAGEVSSNSPFTSFTLRVDSGAAYEVYEQEPIYQVGSLLGEIGGTMGLFIGASVITVYDTIEVVGRKLWNRLMNTNRI